MRKLEQFEQPGDACRAPADDRLRPVQGFPRRIEEAPRPRRRRCGFAPVVGIQALRTRSVVQQKPAPADARGLRLDQVQDELGGNGRVERAATAFQEFVAGARGERMRGHDHEALRADECFRSDPR